MVHLSKRKIMIILAEKRLSVSQLAARVGMRANNFSSVLNRRNCFPTTAGKIASALGVPVTAIIEDGDD